MADITVISTPHASGWVCTVQISESNGQTRHSVTLKRHDLNELSAGKLTTPEELVKRSFEFLLERESKEQILRQFELPTISRYFPEFAAEIRKKFQ